MAMLKVCYQKGKSGGDLGNQRKTWVNEGEFNTILDWTHIYSRGVRLSVDLRTDIKMTCG